MSRPSLLPASLLLLTVLLAGCRDQSIKTYRVPREAVPEAPIASSAPATATPPAMGATPDMASTPVPTASGGDLVWSAPASWQSRPASAMRKGTFIIPGEGGVTAELAITAFPGDVGGDLANVNRWRGQLQLGPISAAELPAALARSKVNGLDIAVTEMVATAGNPPQRVLGAIVPFNGSTWFFKITGPDAVVAGQRETFNAFLQTLRAP
jgi:hypothetical protein